MGEDNEKFNVWLKCPGKHSDCVTHKSLQRFSSSPLTSSTSGLMDNMSKEQNVFAATESEQICKMITGYGSPHCIPASKQQTSTPSKSCLFIHMNK